MHEWLHLNLKVDFRLTDFGEKFHYLLSEFLTEICWEKVTEEIFFLILSFWCLTWGLNRGLMPNKSALYLLDYGDFLEISFLLLKVYVNNFL